KWDIAIDGFWDSHHGERVSPLLGLLEQGFGAALRAITADGKENIDPAADEIVHRASYVHGTSGRAENRSGLQMNTAHHLRSEDERFAAPFRIQPLISPTEAKHLFGTIGVMHLMKQRSDHIVQSGRQSSAGHNAGASVRWMEEQLFARAGQFEEEVAGRARVC